MKKIILNFILALFIFSISTMNVNADSFNVIKGESLFIITVDGVERHIFEKYEEGGTLSSKPLYCVSGIDVAAHQGTYKLKSDSGLTERQLLDIGNIINSSTGTYVEKEIAIFTYLDKPGKMDSTHIAYKIVQDAKTATDNYLNENLNLNFTELTFTLQDNFYKSQKINVSSEANIEDITYSVTSTDINLKPTIEKSDNGLTFIVSIDKNQVESLDKLSTIKVVVKANKTNPKSAVYYTDDIHQEVTKINTEVKKSISQTISGEIGKTKLVISKIDQNNEPLVGAKLKIECISDGCNFESQEIVSTENSYILENIPYGEYKITEIDPPQGYSLLEDSVSITLSSDNLTDEVTIQNKLVEVEVPNTLSARSAFLITISMICIALGIGLIIYVKKIRIYK